ncbi:MAG: type II secretion system ATPase GspE [Desulfomonilia bacterium]|jgi:general secretion pathway protein E|uniref:protein-secreting ATPase n=1 Tax=anaerobic digester metagenome TaxID=1263854 RepID=A0A485M6T6_9ZZZZ|nr:type II secretion system ATPase GspE [Pseudomonadota bacterium]HON37250.1 type II secretion system ATPase GspE [Deltaproteobacteria bacterium]HPD21811.1 type II secretion system ATPase GspE [Deltaproteobacteria bacterium]HRS56620.1 type II secretion system ATPase GspE [Desulfomonilia bacterium]HRV36363.1 type II secretion system ATPase GspE [Desulfomonilia bacterium]
MKIQSLEQVLVEMQLVDDSGLDKAKSVQREKALPLRDALLSAGVLSDHDLLQALARLWNIPLMNKIEEIEVDPSIVDVLPITFLRKYTMVPVKLNADMMEVAVNDPTDQEPLFDIAKILNIREITRVLAPKQEILKAINRLVEMKEENAEDIMEDIEDEDDEILKDLESIQDITVMETEAPIIRMVNRMMVQAFRERASDIHVEPYQTDVKVRYRIDGILHDVLTLPKRIHSAVVSRIKVMASLNIAEKRLPQDGRIGIKLGDHSVDLRISIVPTVNGERVVMRILDKSSVLYGLEELGFYPDDLERIERLIKQEHGIILVTGPTGSGKTTSLYSMLSRINSPDKNILTIEDPIEYQLKGIGQIPVNTKVGLTFASGLRSIVRQDPDVILVGEIRDLETAEIAIQAALTGHLVFSTLHTNDSASAVTRLIDMGIEPFLVTSSVNAILAQRLVRKICPACKQEYFPEDESLLEIGLSKEMLDKEGYLYRGAGCSECIGTGYKGRTGIYEILFMSDAIRSTVLKTSDSNAIKQVAVGEGLHTLRQDGARKVEDGVTTIEEVLRVTQQ